MQIGQSAEIAGVLLDELEDALLAEFEIEERGCEEVWRREDRTDFESSFDYAFRQEKSGTILVELVIVDCELGEEAAELLQVLELARRLNLRFVVIC